MAVNRVGELNDGHASAGTRQANAIGLRWMGTVDNLVVRQAEAADVDALMAMLADPGQRDRLGTPDRERVLKEVASGQPVLWIVVERPKRAVGLIRVQFDRKGQSEPLLTVVESRRWGDQRQAREAVSIVVDELADQGVFVRVVDTNPTEIQ